jgi:undecaprenyl-diphosphatase
MNMVLNWFHSHTVNMFQFIASRDHKLMRRVNRWPAPKWVRRCSILATRAGDGWLWFFAGACVLLFGGVDRFAAVAAAGSAALGGIGIFKLMKGALGRERPCEIEPHCWATLLPPDRFSFPSGHTITAFAVAVTLSAFYPILLPFLLFCALAIAASRILLGMHFLSDVTAGAIIGTGLGLVSYSLFA